MGKKPRKSAAKLPGIGPGNHPNSRAALKTAPPWQPGQSGNPKGIGGDRGSPRAALRRMCQNGAPGQVLEAFAKLGYDEDALDKATNAELVALRTLHNALTKGGYAADKVFDEIDGRIPDKVEITADITISPADDAREKLRALVDREGDGDVD